MSGRGAWDQIVLPRAVREALHLCPGDSLLFLVTGSVLLRKKAANFTEAMRERHKAASMGNRVRPHEIGVNL